MDHPPSPAISKGSVKSGGPRGSRARSRSRAQGITSHCGWRSGLAQSQVTDNCQETSSECKHSNEEEDTPCDDEEEEADKGDAEVLSDGQAASDGNEGQGHASIQNTLMGVSHIFGMHKETDAESDTEKKIQSIWQKWHPPSPKEDTPCKESSESSSEESSQPMRLSATRPGNGLGSWTQISMLGGARRLLKVLQAGP